MKLLSKILKIFFKRTYTPKDHLIEKVLPDYEKSENNSVESPSITDVQHIGSSTSCSSYIKPSYSADLPSAKISHSCVSSSAKNIQLQSDTSLSITSNVIIYKKSTNDESESKNSAFQTTSYIKTTPFINQLRHDSKKEICFIYCELESELFKSILWIAEKAKKHIKLTNLFPDDDNNVIYFTVYDRAQYDYIGLMNYALDYCKIIRDITFYGNSAKELASSIANHGIDYVQNECKDRNNALSKLDDATCQRILRFTSTELSLIINNIETEENNYIYWNCLGNKYLYKDIYNSLLTYLGIDAIRYVKWKNEYMMYLLIKLYYPDAVFQYRDVWLGHQSLDVYVPSIQTGFEYQGKQHYEEVEIFGGKDALQHRMENDKIKREKCKNQNINLVEWMYTEKINGDILRSKLQTFEIVLSTKINIIALTSSEKDFTDARIEINRKVEPRKLIRIAIEYKNFEAAYFALEKIVSESIFDATYYWESMLGVFSESQLKLLRERATVNSSNQEKFTNALTHSHALIEYYLSDKSIRNNYSTRRIFLQLIKQGETDSDISELINTMRSCCIKNGESRADFNRKFKQIYFEASEYGVRKEKVKEILALAKISISKSDL